MPLFLRPSFTLFHLFHPLLLYSDFLFPSSFSLPPSATLITLPSMSPSLPPSQTSHHSLSLLFPTLHPSSSLLSDFYPSPSPPYSPFLSVMNKEVFRRRERESEEVGGEGWDPIRAAVSSFHVVRNTAFREANIRQHPRTSTCTRRTLVGTHNLTPTQVRRPSGGGGWWREVENLENKWLDL